MFNKKTVLSVVLWSGSAIAQTALTSTPRPIDPAAGSTNPSARATQTLNPYLGSTPEGQVVDEVIKLSLEDAVARGLRFNLGLIDSQQSDSTVRAQRERAFSALLPQISARVAQTYEQLSFKEIGLKIPPGLGFQIPATSGGFGFSDARVSVQFAVFNSELLQKYKGQKIAEAASLLNTKDARDVVVLAVGAAYFQVVASQARLDAAQASVKSAQELDKQVADQFKAEVSPEIDTLRAQVELSAAEQRVVNARNDLEKDKLTLDRITGIPLAQAWTVSKEYGYRPVTVFESAEALATRSDLASLKQSVLAAEIGVKAAHAERLPSISFDANYGGAGLNIGNYNHVYELTGSVSVPLFTGGRIRSDVHQAQAALVQRRAEYRDLEGRVDYDVRVAQLDVKASESAVKVAEKNKALAQKAYIQSEDRFQNGVTNYLEVIQAQEAIATANENYIASLFSFNVSKIALARAMGSAETRLAALFQ